MPKPIKIIKSRKIMNLNSKTRESSDEKLALAAQEWEDTFDAITDMISIQDKDFNIVRVNRAYAESFGLKPSELIGRKCYEIAHKTNKPIKGCPHIATIKKGKQGRFEGYDPYLKKHLEISTSPIKNKAGKVNCSVHVIKDISEKMNRINELEKSSKELKKFKLAVEYASDMVIITDKDGVLIYANKAAEKISGYTRAEMIGRCAGGSNLWGGLMEKKFYDKLWKQIRDKKKAFIGELKNRRKDGQEYEAEVRISPIMDAKKNIIFFVGIERDISEQKAIERTKKDFLSLASHQMRTPLASISLSAELLLKGGQNLNSEQKAGLYDIYKDVFKMSELIDSLLNISKIEMGTFTAEPEPLRIVELVDYVLDEVDTQAINKRIMLNKYMDKSLPTIITDKNIIRVVLQNLLTNAIKYTPEKGRIDIKARRQGNKIIISVKDSGVGIPSGEKDKVFTKYYRAPNVKKLDAGGTGLGLYITKSLLEQVGGRVWFKSTINKGSEFFVEVPL